jgi:hypothetical protein
MMKCPDSIIAHVRGPYHAAVDELRENGEIPCIILTMKYVPACDEVDQVQTVAVYNLDTADKKDSAAQKLRELIKTNNANAVVVIADGYVTPRESVGTTRGNTQSEEVVAVHIEVDGMGHWGCARKYSRIGKQIFIESEMPEINAIPDPDQGRFVFFKSSRAIIFKPEFLPDAEREKVLADSGVRRVAYVQDASASELAAAIRRAGCPVVVQGMELRDGLAHGWICWIQHVLMNDQSVVEIVANSDTGTPIAANQLANDLDLHGDAKVVLVIESHPHRLYSVCVKGGVSAIIHNGRIG